MTAFAAAAGAACVALMAAIVYVDVTVRLIPRQLCWALAVAGAVFQAGSQGAAGLAFGLTAAVATVALCALLGWAGQRFGSKASIGGGDVRCMAALAVATGPGCLTGMLACSIAALAYAVPKRVTGRLLPGEGFAFAPFLAVWLAVGMLACVPGAYLSV